MSTGAGTLVWGCFSAVQATLGMGKEGRFEDGINNLLLWAVREKEESKMTPTFHLEYMTCIFSGVSEFGNGNIPCRKLD